MSVIRAGVVVGTFLDCFAIPWIRSGVRCIQTADSTLGVRPQERR